ncbi:MAG: glycoside hydrolase family 38 C-terminal domain-containing protein [Candidatus Aminicenantales bacterium]
MHLICGAHLDPVWQWRWDEGASEALATFRNAVDILDEHPSLVFCHNEAVLYRWAERLDPALFNDIRRLVKAGRWAISGGWFIQPDVNLPGTEALIRTIAEGRRYFRDRFDAAPRVAYNFDSFGHSGGLPQILRLAGYEMYVHMRPQADELTLPADLYRWRGVDGTTIPAYRIAVGLYHTEHDNVEDRLRAGVELALKLGRDVPVFWGLGNHGGGATRRDLETIDAFIAREPGVRVIHSTPDRFYDAVKDAAAVAPIHDGDLQRSFTGCYTSLSRLKRRAVASLGSLVQADAASAAASWLAPKAAPEPDLAEAWRLHLFNDFHDILTGTCVEPAERDALGQYGRAEDIGRAAVLRSLASLNLGGRNSPSLPVTVFNANPSLRRIPVEFECMADHRPFWKGTWRMRLFRADGREIVCQEEQPESLLPFNSWRRRISFVDDLPGVGVSRYYLRAFEIPSGKTNEAESRGHVPRVHVPDREPVQTGGLAGGHVPKVRVPIAYRIDRATGLVRLLKTGPGRTVKGCLAGPLFEPLVIEDTADSWGTGCGSYRKIVGRFKPSCRPFVIERGPVRTVTRSIFSYRKSRVITDVVAYPSWPVLEFRFRVTWNEARRRLKLSVPTSLSSPTLLAEVPGGAIHRPADGEEHVHGRWLVVEGRSAGAPAAIGVASSGQNGLDFKAGEIRLSVLRSSAYCHERGFDLDAAASKMGTRTKGTCPPIWKFADIGVHEFRLLVAAGDPASVKALMPGLADHLAAPPAAYAHLPYNARQAQPRELLFSLKPSSVRMLACKRSWDGGALILRLQEAVGKKTKCELKVEPAAPRTRGNEPASDNPEAEDPRHASPAQERGHVPRVHIPLSFAPFEIKTLRVERNGGWRPVRMIEED